MFIKIDFSSEIPIYLQLRNEIVEGIAKSLLKPGDLLPSVRQMGEDLGINLHTANKAYAILKDEGFVQMHKRSGVVVSSFDDMKRANYLEPLKESLRPLVAESLCRSVSKEELSLIIFSIYDELKKGGENV